MMRRDPLNENGYSLLESVFAMGLFLLCVLTTIKMAGMVIRANQLARDYAAALYLAENKMEEISALSYNDISDMEELNVGARTDGGKAIYHRRVSVTAEKKPVRKTVVVSVTWQEKKCREIVLGTIVAP